MTAAASAVAFAGSTATAGGLVIAAAAFGYAAAVRRVDAAAHLQGLIGVLQIWGCGLAEGVCGSRPLQGSKSRVGIGPDCLPNCELGLLFGMLTLGHFLVGREFELVQVNRHFAFLHSGASVFSQVPFLRNGVLSPPFAVLTPPFLFPSEVDRLQIRV